jgi:hypothetical protein
VMLRKRLRQDINAIKAGNKLMPDAGMSSTSAIPTYAGDTVLRVAPAPGEERKLILEVSRKVAAVYMGGDHLRGAERYEFIEKSLGTLEQKADFGAS